MRTLAFPFLQAAYQGTIRAACAHDKQKVFLTIVGGGIFSNPLSWIAEAIKETLPFIKGHDMQVYVVCRMNENNLNTQEHSFLQQLKSLEF